MKIKNLALMALAASLSLAACDNEDKGGSQPQDLMPKSVTITLPNIQAATRATGDAMPGGSQVELENFKVFFVTGTNEAVIVPQFNGQDQKVYFSSSDLASAVGNKLTYHFLPASTVKVVVVGNIGDETYDNVKTLVYDVQNDDENGHPLYPLYGDSGLTKDAVTDEEGHYNVYTANVTLQPRVSRFEIYGFEYAGSGQEDVNAAYTSVTLDKIALNCYYTKYNFVEKTPLEEDSCFEDPNPTTAWDWIAGRTAPWSDVLKLTLNAGEKKFLDGTAIDDPNEDGEEAKGIVTYGLAHVTDATKNPELLLALTGTKEDGGVTPLYLRGRFTGSQAFESGKIYRVLYSFTDEDFDEPQRCVELTVTVDNWTVVAVTPEF